MGEGFRAKKQWGAQENLWPKFILKSAPLRATSSVLEYSTLFANPNVVKIQGRSKISLVGISGQRERITSAAKRHGTGRIRLLKTKIRPTRCAPAVQKFFPSRFSFLSQTQTPSAEIPAVQTRPVTFFHQNFALDSAPGLHQNKSFRYNEVRFRKPLCSAPLAQLDRASGYEPEGREFESLRAHHFLNKNAHFLPARSDLRILFDFCFTPTARLKLPARSCGMSVVP